MLLLLPFIVADSSEENDIDHGIIVQCLVENWGQEEKIQDCRKCFEDIGEDILSENNLPVLKQCITQYLPIENEACASDLEALQAEDEEQGGKVLKCAWEAIHINGLNYCLNATSTDSSVVDRLTDASMCIGKGHKYIKHYVMNVTMSDEQRKKMEKKQKKFGPMKMKMAQLFTKAHCDLATNGDSAKDRACNKCFNKGLRTFKRSKDVATLKANSAQCTKEHLGDQYSQCSNLIETDVDKETVHGCFMRVLTKSQVEECTNEDSTADAETLAGVMECTKKRAIAWVEENASGKVKRKFLEMLGGRDDDEYSKEELE